MCRVGRYRCTGGGVDLAKAQSPTHRTGDITAPQPLDGDLAEYIASVLGAVAVLAVGLIWRRRRLRRLDELALSRSADAAQPVDRL